MDTVSEAGSLTDEERELELGKCHVKSISCVVAKS